MRSVMDIFALWPADAELGRDIGVPYPTVSAWKQRGSIPAAYWRDIVLAARRRGHAEITADLLAELHARKPANETGGGFAEENDVSHTLQAWASLPAVQRLHAEDGHFSQWRHLRRGNYASQEQIAAHVGALREEWDRR